MRETNCCYHASGDWDGDGAEQNAPRKTKDRGREVRILQIP
ncbi:MAG: hypothetical protein U9P61_01830 [Patescibacteria group bacterium]|nr:hypothetical protein [Patescibacteria group bacterium]